MASDEEPVEKALKASPSVAVTSKDSANSNLTTLIAPAESLPGEVREPLSGGASTPLSGRASTPLSGRASTPLSGRASTPSGVRANDEEPVEKTLMTSSSVVVTSEDSANSNISTLVAPAEYLLGEVREPLSGGASTPNRVRTSPETARPSPAVVPATETTGVDTRSNRIHRSNFVTRRAAAELTGAVTRYRGVRPNKTTTITITTSTITTTWLWRNVSSRVRCTSFAAQTRTRQMLRISLMPRRLLLKSPTPGAARSRAVREWENRTGSCKEAMTG